MTGGLLAALAGCGGGLPPQGAGSVTSTGPANAQTAEVKGDTQLVFVPGVVQARVGTLTLTLGNIGGTPHNLTFVDPGLAGIGLVGAGGTRSTTLVFTKPGVYPFLCTIHGGMTGKVVVTG